MNLRASAQAYAHLSKSVWVRDARCKGPQGLIQVSPADEKILASRVSRYRTANQRWWTGRVDQGDRDN
jgi:hypothetical protein